MKIGVIIPAYNAERYVADCLDSILAQTHRDFEVYVMDDGSTDGTGDAIRAYAARDPRIRVWRQENRSLVVATMNALLDRLDPSVEAVSFVDIDDFIHPEMFARLAAALERTDADVAECRIVYLPQDAHPQSAFQGPVAAGERTVGDMSIYWLRRTSPAGWINKQNKLYRRRVLDGIRFRQTLSYEEDYFFACEVNAAIRRKVILDAEMYAYRDNPNSATSRISFAKYVQSTAERIRLCCEIFLKRGRVPAEFERGYREDLSKDAYRMVIRKNLKKNGSADSRRALFLSAGERLAALEREYGFVPVGLNPVQRLIWSCCRRGRYALARLLVFLT